MGLSLCPRKLRHGELCKALSYPPRVPVVGGLPVSQLNSPCPIPPRAGLSEAHRAVGAQAGPWGAHRAVGGQAARRTAWPRVQEAATAPAAPTRREPLPPPLYD